MYVTPISVLITVLSPVLTNAPNLDITRPNHAGMTPLALGVTHCMAKGHRAALLQYAVRIAKQEKEKDAEDDEVSAEADAWFEAMKEHSAMAKKLPILLEAGSDIHQIIGMFEFTKAVC